MYGKWTTVQNPSIYQVLCKKENLPNRIKLSATFQDAREQRKKTIFNLWLACNTQQEIADKVEIKQGGDLSQILSNLEILENLPKPLKLSATFQGDYENKLYSQWVFKMKTNEVAHFGNTEQRILENLLYLYTKPFDGVIDPFAGGGSTIDICNNSENLPKCYNFVSFTGKKTGFA